LSVEVGIVGPGLAGLRVAGLLEDAGVEVALFEAAPAAGARRSRFAASSTRRARNGSTPITHAFARFFSLADAR
jgi:monoamine oxidase